MTPRRNNIDRGIVYIVKSKHSDIPAGLQNLRVRNCTQNNSNSHCDKASFRFADFSTTTMYARLSFEHAVLHKWIPHSTLQNAPRFGRLSQDGKPGVWEDEDARAAQATFDAGEAKSNSESLARLTKLTKAAELFDNGSESNPSDISSEGANTPVTTPNNSTKKLSKAAKRRLRKSTCTIFANT